MRFFLVDRITEITSGKDATGIKCWSLDNEIFQDHFPGFPTVPGVLLTESMAQLAGILIKKSYYAEYGDKMSVYPVLSIIQKAKFRSFVKPGDQCFLKANLISVDRGRGNAKVSTTVDGLLVCEATLSFVIGMQGDMDDNQYIERMEEYYSNIMPREK